MERNCFADTRPVPPHLQLFVYCLGRVHFFFWFLFHLSFSLLYLYFVGNVYRLTKPVKGTQEYWHRDKMGAD